MDNDKSEGRISRWSKRKLAVAKEQDQADDSPEHSDVAGDAAQEAQLEAELLANREAAEAVDLDKLNEESDFSVFMKAGVPELLKKRAMASLWRTSPVFANVDGLVDYDDDFASPDLIMKTFKSAYEIGKGYFDEEEEGEEQIATESEEQLESEQVEDDDAARQPLEEETQEPASLAEEGTEKSPEDTALAAEPEAEDDFEPVEVPEPKISLRRRLELEQSS